MTPWEPPKPSRRRRAHAAARARRIVATASASLAAVLVGVMAYGAHATQSATPDDGGRSTDSVVTSTPDTAQSSVTSEPQQAPLIVTPDTTPVTRSHGS
jgi:D-serine deaminase-like pyridoxal phosphate-dependent protein